MRKGLIPAVLATLLVATLGAPAAADATDKTDVIPLDYWFEAWNPCTEQMVLTHFTGELQVQALPSIEALYANEGTHQTAKWVGQFVAEDGYSTERKHYATGVVNIRDVDPPHVVATEVNNIMFVGDDGGKYKVSYRAHVTIVDGEPKTLTHLLDLRCIHQPGS